MWLGVQTTSTLLPAQPTLSSTSGTLTSIVSLLLKNCLDPIRILECKANGLTFDPFGKFLAS